MDIKYEDIFPTSESEIGEKDISVNSDNLVRESVRRLILQEVSVEKPLSLVDKLVEMNGFVEINGNSDDLHIYVKDEDNELLAEIQTILAADKEPFFLDHTDHSVHEAGRAYDGHTVVYAKNYSGADGFGILAYEIALELCSLYSTGLCPDRFEVSGPAYDVWYAYNSDRNDVMKKQLDMAEYPLTSDKIDDGSMVSSVRVYYNWADDFGPNLSAGLVGPKDYIMDIDYVQDWLSKENPLSKFYYKQSFPVVNELIMNSPPGAEIIEWQTIGTTKRNEQMMKDLWNKLGHDY